MCNPRTNSKKPGLDTKLRSSLESYAIDVLRGEDRTCLKKAGATCVAPAFRFLPTQSKAVYEHPKLSPQLRHL